MPHMVASTAVVKHFQHILVWPLQLVPSGFGEEMARHWQKLGPPWRKVEDEFVSDHAQFQERHYREFVSFLPHVQHFLYGEAHQRAVGRGYGESPIHVVRRSDVKSVRVTIDRHAVPVTLDVAHIDLYFFYDMDVVMLNVEVAARDVPLSTVQDLMFRFGRAFPAGWNDEDEALHCPSRVEWLDADGKVLATSDYEKPDRYLSAVCRNRSAEVAAHWEFLLAPMVPDQSAGTGKLRYRHLEDYRIPGMGYLAMENVSSLTRADYVRLGLNTGPGRPEELPYSGAYLTQFEAKHCYDRFHDPERPTSSNMRLICSGWGLIMVTGAAHGAVNPERGLLGEFRHKYFLLFLIARFHKAALLMLSDRLAVAVNALDIGDRRTVGRFAHDMRIAMETFLRFTHRYWFQEVSNQTQASEIFHMLTQNIGTQRLHNEVKEELGAMSSYLDSESLRRQSRFFLQLTVVTIFAMVGTIATSFLGMNVFELTAAPVVDRIVAFGIVFLGVILLTAYTIAKSRRLAVFLDAFSDDRSSLRAKVDAFLDIWRRETK